MCETTGRLNKAQSLACQLHEAFCALEHKRHVSPWGGFDKMLPTETCSWWDEINSMRDRDLASAHNWEGQAHVYWFNKAKRVLGMGYQNDIVAEKARAEGIAYGFFKIVEENGLYRATPIRWAGLNWEDVQDWVAGETDKRNQLEREELERKAEKKAAILAQIDELQKQIDAL
jgi:hypothetical protein